MFCQLSITFGAFLLQSFAFVGPAGSSRTDIVRQPETNAALRHRFSAEDEALLDEVQRACFQYLWREVGSPGRLVKDRKKAPVSSVAAVGFQLSALPIAVERGWVTRAEGLERARIVLETLIRRADNKKLGIYLHYVDYDTGGLSHTGYEVLASTVDTALLVAGAIPAAEYFGGDVKALVDRMIAHANWRAYATGPNGLIAMGWRPDDPHDLSAGGRFHPAHWNIASGEERLIYFLAAAAPDPAHAVEPQTYYRLNRVIKRYKDMPPYAVSYQGTLFNHFFSHCWIDYRALGLDDPARLGVGGPRVDWFENSRRAVLTHRRRCIEQAGRFKSLGENLWGLSACAGRDGYLVPEVQPNVIDKDQWYEGTVAPYAAASSIMFAPAESMGAIRAFRALTDGQGRPFVWRDPAGGGYGFADSFNLDQDFASDDYVGIDQGPMLLAIENARTGLIWKLFMSSETARLAVARLRLAE